MRKLPTRKLLGVIIAGALFLPNQAFTLGLGEIEVNSALNQKLKADIELLSATPEDAETLIIKLASRKEFTRAGLDRPYALNDLRFKSTIIDGVPYINVSSSSPIREPFLNFLVEVDWPNGHLLREYTVLLDPPVFMTQSAPVASNQSATADNSFRAGVPGSTNVVPVVSPNAQLNSRPSESSPQVAPASNNEAPVTSSFVPAPVVQQQASINQPTGAYRIKAGDTAWSLANAMRPDQNISVEQMMIAMLRANPESFIDENVNGLKRGYILRVPDYEQIASVNQSDARALVREQAALWKQYQQSQSGGQPVSAMEAGDAMGSASAGESASAETDDAYLEIVSAGSGSSTISGKDPTQMSAKELRAELALARERVETELVEKEALQGRIESLEQRVDKMKGMLSIEDNELSEVQSLNMPDDTVVESTEMEAEEELQDALAEESTEIADVDSMEAEVEAEAAAEESEIDAAVMEGEEAIESEMAEEGAVEEGMEEEAVFTDEAMSEPMDEAAPEAVLEVPEQPDMAADNGAAPQAPTISQEPTDFLSKLLNNPIMLAAMAGGLALVLLVAGIFVKRRKAANADEPAVVDGFDDLESIADEVSNEAEAASDDVVVESLAGDSESDFDSDATMILDSPDETVVTEAAPEAGVEEEEEARDDVIAEADVYLAYGIYQQAEDLLTQAIAENPERDDYRVKLAETHYASKNTEAFVEVASEVHKRADNDDSPAWKKVMVMGQDMCADNPLFQGSMVGGLDVSSLAPAGAPEMDFDLGMDASDDDASSDLDLSLDDEALELPVMEDAPAEDMSDADETQILSDEPVEELEFDLSDTGAVEAATAADSDDEFSLDIDATELDIDTDLEDTATAVADAVEEVEESIDLGDIDVGLDLDTEDSSPDEILDVGEIDLDFGLDDAEETVAKTDEAVDEIASIADDEEVSLDLTDDIESLDMDLGDAPESEEVAPAVESSSDDDDDFDLSDLDDVDEISTKLDLARAYLDMGDNEGSRGILEEVIAEGSDEQKQEASDLIAKLD